MEQMTVGGGGGIRTPGALTDTAVFKAAGRGAGRYRQVSGNGVHSSFETGVVPMSLAPYPLVPLIRAADGRQNENAGRECGALAGEVDPSQPRHNPLI